MTRWLATALLVLAPMAGFAAAAQPAAQLKALEQRWLTAAVQRDRATLDRLLADTFVDISYRGARRTKADVLAAPAAPAGSRQVLSDLDVRVYGSTAVVTGVNTVTAGDRGAARVRFTDVFVRSDGAWRAVSAQETLEQPADRHRR